MISRKSGRPDRPDRTLVSALNDHFAAHLFRDIRTRRVPEVLSVCDYNLKTKYHKGFLGMVAEMVARKVGLGKRNIYKIEKSHRNDDS
jgi:hypothetical protein